MGLGAIAKPKKGAQAARKTSVPTVVEPVAAVEKEPAPAPKSRIEGSAWGKSSAEARKAAAEAQQKEAAQQREAERVAAEAAAAEDARREAEEANLAAEAAAAEAAEAKRKADEEA